MNVPNEGMDQQGPRELWVIFARSCSDCGPKKAVRLLSHEPTEAEEQAVAKAIGGMFCIHTDVVKLEIDGETVTIDPD